MKVPSHAKPEPPLRRYRTSGRLRYLLWRAYPGGHDTTMTIVKSRDVGRGASIRSRIIARGRTRRCGVVFPCPQASRHAGFAAADGCQGSSLRLPRAADTDAARLARHRRSAHRHRSRESVRRTSKPRQCCANRRRSSRPPPSTGSGCGPRPRPGSPRRARPAVAPARLPGPRQPVLVRDIAATGSRVGATPGLPVRRAASRPASPPSSRRRSTCVAPPRAPRLHPAPKPGYRKCPAPQPDRARAVPPGSPRNRARRYAAPDKRCYQAPTQAGRQGQVASLLVSAMDADRQHPSQPGSGQRHIERNEDGTVQPEHGAVPRRAGFDANLFVEPDGFREGRRSGAAQHFAHLDRIARQFQDQGFDGVRQAGPRRSANGMGGRLCAAREQPKRHRARQQSADQPAQRTAVVLIHALAMAHGTHRFPQFPGHAFQHHFVCIPSGWPCRIRARSRARVFVCARSARVGCSPKDGASWTLCALRPAAAGNAEERRADEAAGQTRLAGRAGVPVGRCEEGPAVDFDERPRWSRVRTQRADVWRTPRERKQGECRAG